MSPLNERLYDALRELYGRVEISNPGEHRIADPSAYLVASSSRTIQGGEQYRIDCPFCRDTKGRFYVSHAYGEIDEATGRRNNHLVHCFNDACHENSHNRYLFQLAVGDALYRLRTRRKRKPPQPIIVKAPPSITPAPPKINWPDNLIPLNRLDADHHAIRYLKERNYDPLEVWATHQVYYCQSDPNAKPRIYDRLVLPIYQPDLSATPKPGAGHPKVLAGWQARAIGPVPAGVPKYLSAAGMAKSKILYGLPAAQRRGGHIYLCEGPTDCWRLGLNSVALLGKTMSDHQRRLLLHCFAGREIVIFLDNDAHVDAKKIERELQVARRSKNDSGRVVIAHLPAGRKDPGECTIPELDLSASDALMGPIIMGRT